MYIYDIYNITVYMCVYIFRKYISTFGEWKEKQKSEDKRCDKRHIYSFMLLCYMIY